jgi:hypothetical protein
MRIFRALKQLLSWFFCPRVDGFAITSIEPTQNGWINVLFRPYYWDDRAPDPNRSNNSPTFDDESEYIKNLVKYFWAPVIRDGNWLRTEDGFYIIAKTSPSRCARTGVFLMKFLTGVISICWLSWACYWGWQMVQNPEIDASAPAPSFMLIFLGTCVLGLLWKIAEDEIKRVELECALETPYKQMILATFGNTETTNLSSKHGQFTESQFYFVGSDSFHQEIVTQAKSY